jgi:hypothetical protein
MSKKQTTIEELQTEVKQLKELLEKNNSALEDLLKCVRDTNIKIDLLEQNKHQLTEVNRVAPKKLVGKGKSNNRKANKKIKLDEPDECDETKTELGDDNKNNDSASVAETTLDYENETSDSAKLTENDNMEKLPIKKSIKIVNSDIAKNKSINTSKPVNTRKSVNVKNTKKESVKSESNDSSCSNAESKDKAASENKDKAASESKDKSKTAGTNIINAFKLKFKENESYFNEWLTDSVKEEIKTKSKEDWTKIPSSKKVNLYYNYMKDNHFNILDNLKKLCNNN